MRRVLCAVALGLILGSGVAVGEQTCDGCGTTVSVDYLENVAWTEAGSPYCIDRDITVNLLTIEPGVCVRVGEGHTIEVVTITAIGTIDLPIVFTAIDSSAAWSGLHFQDQGTGSRFIYCRFEHAQGSALLLTNSQPEISNCAFIDNHAGGYGGAVKATIASGDLAFIDCVFTGNTSAYEGGAIWATLGSGVLAFHGCTIDSNTAIGYEGSYGGGLLVNGNCVLEQSRVINNRSNAYPEGGRGHGGGIYSSGGLLTLLSCEVRENTAWGQGYWNTPFAFGGGIYVSDGSVVARNTFICCNGCTAYGYNYGAGVYVGAGGSASLENCTLARNNIEAVHSDADTVTVRNSILYFNNDNAGQFVGSVRFAFSDVQGDTIVAGEGNIQWGPVFHGLGCSLEDLTIGEGRCVDAGDPDAAFHDGCLPPGLGSQRNDMGAHGGPENCGWIRPPAPPSGLVAESGSSDVSLQWDPVADKYLAGYRICRSDSSDPTHAIDSVGVATVEYVDRRAMAGTRYYYRVQAYSVLHEGGGFSNEICATRGDGTAPSAPSELVATAGVDSISLGWFRSPECDLASYRLYRGSQSPDGLLATIPPGTEHYVDRDVSVGLVYAYQLKAVDNAGNESGRSSVVLTQLPSADLAVSAEVDDADPSVLGIVVYTIRAMNNGPELGRNVAVTIIMPPGVGFVSSEADSGDFNGQTWSIGELASAEENRLEITGSVEHAGPDTLTASIAGTDPADPVPDNNETSVAIWGRMMADLLVEANVSNPTPIIGRDVRFTVTVTDLGPGGAVDIAIADSLPAGLVFRSAQPSPETSYSEAEGRWTIPDLAANEVVVLTITANVQALPDTCVAYRLSSTPADPDPGNDRASIVLRDGAADLAVEKTVDDASPLEGSAVNFTVTLANTSQDPSYDIVVSDLLPSGLSLTNASASPGTYYDRGTGAWTLATLPGESTGTLSITATAVRPGSFKNKVRISDAAVRDPIAANNADSVLVQVCPAADLALTGEAQPDTARIGDSALFIMRVVNEGPSAATGVVIDDPIPIGLIAVDTTMTLGSTYANDQWSIPTLPNSSTATLTLTVTSDVEGVFANLASVASSNAGDPVPDNNTVTASLRFVAPPVIDPETPPMATEGSEVEIRASITDNTGVASAILYYRQASQTDFTSIAMSHGGGSLYQATIPGGAVHAEGVVLYIRAADLDDNSSHSVDFPVIVQTGGQTNQAPQPCGTTQAAYRLISIPLDLADPSAESVLRDDLGPYGTTWRFFGLQADQSYVEYPDVDPMTPGKAFWLAVSECNRVIDTGPGHCVPPDSAFSIPLHARWNFIGDPFLFSIPLENIRMESGQTPDLMRYVGVWSGLGTGEVLAPFAGYAAWVDQVTGDRLLFDPDLTPGRARRLEASSEDSWSVRIRAEIEGASDNENLIAVDQRASVDLDPLDRPEPPVVGDYVSLYFDHPEWEALAERYRTDVRPGASDGCTWDLAVRSNISSRMTLRFEGAADVPPEYQVLLIDPDLEIWQNLRDVATYQYINGGNEAPRKLQLVVGRADFAKETLDERLQEPGDLVLHSFPNPFRGMTTIRFGLPGEERVTLRIMDVGGGLVATIVDGERMRAGYHAIIWDGRNSRGALVTSGLYLYQLNTERRSLTDRLMLVR
jgi:uncharacterized repeat protein (TIGR01451 family)